MKTELIIIGVLLVAGIVFFKKFSSEKERIKTFFRIYKTAKAKFPNATEREILEIVIEEHILPGKITRLRNSGISGKQYLDEVFESRQIDLDDLISHVIVLEFPQKYKPFEANVNLDEIRERNRTGKLSTRDELKSLIKKYHKEFLG